MVKIRIGGVPEHYNYPIRLAQEKGMFAAHGIEVEWHDFPGGTGQMTKALRDDEVDVCVLLTEGIVADIVNGNPSKIISDYVITPLTWGIHTAAANSLKYHSEIYDRKYAISRYGSGSHLMAIVDAESNGRRLNHEQFHVINDINGALVSLKNFETDVFYWEKYTTKPYVDAGILRRVGEFNTPWPCFVMAATDKILKSNRDSVIHMKWTIHSICGIFMQDKSFLPEVAKRYNQKLKDIERWYNSAEWATHGWVNDKMIENVLYHLRNAEIIAPVAKIPEIVMKRE
jgi:ABC-type nitrate/sulfonate/bicarbonate transport system substrate-binding protein